MTAPKIIPFDVEYIRMAQFAAALAHPARVAIVRFLQNKDEVSFKDIVNEIPLAQATISQHIKTLLDAGLLFQYPSGPRMSYALNCEEIQHFCHKFQCTLGTQTSES